MGTGSNTKRTQKHEGPKYKMTYVHPHIYTIEYPRFSVWPPPLYSVLLASLAHQLNCNWFMHTGVGKNWINLSPIFKTWFEYKYSAYQVLQSHNDLINILLECVYSQNIIIFIYFEMYTFSFYVMLAQHFLSCHLPLNFTSPHIFTVSVYIFVILNLLAASSRGQEIIALLFFSIKEGLLVNMQ